MDRSRTFLIGLTLMLAALTYGALLNLQVQTSRDRVRLERIEEKLDRNEGKTDELLKDNYWRIQEGCRAGDHPELCDEKGTE